MQALFILNPGSGHLRRRPELAGMIRAFVREAGWQAELAPTQAPGHATVLAREAAARGLRLVVAVGGDGTVNEAASGLLGSPTRLGILPLGSGNGLARDLGYSMTPESALRELSGTRERCIDVGMAGDRPFFCTAGTGFDACLVERFNRRQRRGFTGYFIEALRLWRAYRAETYELSGNGFAPVRRSALMVTVANARQFGNNARIAPQAVLDDGLLDLVVTSPLGAHQVPGFAWRLFSGRLRAGALVQHCTTSSLRVTASRPVRFHVDGELLPTPFTQMDFGLRKRALHVLAPR